MNTRRQRTYWFPITSTVPSPTISCGVSNTFYRVPTSSNVFSRLPFHWFLQTAGWRTVYDELSATLLAFWTVEQTHWLRDCGLVDHWALLGRSVSIPLSASVSLSQQLLNKHLHEPPEHLLSHRQELTPRPSSSISHIAPVIFVDRNDDNGWISAETDLRYLPPADHRPYCRSTSDDIKTITHKNYLSIADISINFSVSTEEDYLRESLTYLICLESSEIVPL